MKFTTFGKYQLIVWWWTINLHLLDDLILVFIAAVLLRQAVIWTRVDYRSSITSTPTNQLPQSPHACVENFVVLWTDLESVVKQIVYWYIFIERKDESFYWISNPYSRSFY